jgi:hypothetical protein
VELEVNKIKVKCAFVSAGNSISSSIKIKKCKTLACELKPWKTKIYDLQEIIKIFHVDFKFEVTLTLMTLHKLYLRVNSPIFATLLNKD